MPSTSKVSEGEDITSIKKALEELRQQQHQMKVSRVEDQVNNLRSMCSGVPTPDNTQVLGALNTLAREARGQDHQQSQLYSELYNRALDTQSKIRLADLVRHVLGGSEQDKIQASLNKVMKTAEVEAKLEAAKTAPQPDQSYRSPLSKVYRGPRTVNYPQPKYRVPMRRRSEDRCDLCGVTGHYMRTCPKLDQAKASVQEGGR